MKTCISKGPLVLGVLIISLGLSLADRVSAQTFGVLHSFTAYENGVNGFNSDGAAPLAGLILSDNSLYGTTQGGGSSGRGTVFALNTDGTGFKSLHSFSTNDSGSFVQCSGVVLSGSNLYGPAVDYPNSKGGVFVVSTDGTAFTTLEYFHGSSMPYPIAGLIVSDNAFYGTTPCWGLGDFGGRGTVFAIASMGFTILHNFGGTPDGAHSRAGLVIDRNSLFGTTWYGGNSGNGTVFRLNTDGTAYTVLYSFTGFYTTYTTNSDGASPNGLVLSGSQLYGTSTGGGSAGYGTVFRLKTDGTGFTTLHTFTGRSDGARPIGELVLSGDTLYGAAYGGGSLAGYSGSGTVFKVNTDGTSFATLHVFTPIPNPPYVNADGAHPAGGLVLAGNNLYGAAANGGSSGNGTVFSISLPVSPPRLNAIPSGSNVILTWSTNATGFTVQCTKKLVSPAVWTTNSITPTVVNGQNTVTNPISGPQQFFRLSQ